MAEATTFWLIDLHCYACGNTWRVEYHVEGSPLADVCDRCRTPINSYRLIHREGEDVA